jgi:hypothetical protein
MRNGIQVTAWQMPHANRSTTGDVDSSPTWRLTTIAAASDAAPPSQL